MGIEIERKFLVKTDAWRAQTTGTFYCQGYIAKTSETHVRVRIAGDQGVLTLKGNAENLVRSEFEYSIPLDDAREMLEMWCNPFIVEKIRYRVPVGELIWEVDEFAGLNAGLIVAEVELNDPDQVVPLPDWVGEEVSGQTQYYNSSLAIHPYSAWTP
jgi:adenylate cyclase